MAQAPGSQRPPVVSRCPSQLPVPRQISVADSVDVVIDDCSVRAVKRSP